MQNVKINDKWNILLPEHRAARPEWYTEKGWERERLDSLHEHLSSEDLVFYVGTEEGDMAGLLALWGVRLALFEPNDKVWSNVKAIWEANSLPSPLLTFSGFASDTNNQPDRGKFWQGFPPSADGPMIGDHGFKELCDPGDIPQVRLDDVNLIPTAIVMDVEGSEWEVLKGASNLLRTVKPKLWISIHPEFMFRLYGQYQAELRKWIRDFGYKEHLLAYDHEVHMYFEPILGI